MFMMRKLAMLCLAALAFIATMAAQERPVPKGAPKLDHVFIIMMENPPVTWCSFTL
jgi:hypothetical protein